MCSVMFYVVHVEQTQTYAVDGRAEPQTAAWLLQRGARRSSVLRTLLGVLTSLCLERESVIDRDSQGLVAGGERVLSCLPLGSTEHG